jgi:hypothetical protein
VRDVEKAGALLVQAAAASQNTALEKAFAAFTGLTPAMRKAVLGSIEILDRRSAERRTPSAYRRPAAHDCATWQGGTREGAARRLVVASHLRRSTG